MSSRSRPTPVRRVSIEAVVPLHETARPIERTLISLLDQRAGLDGLNVDLGVTVVCHNITAASVRSVLSAELLTDNLSLLEFNDGIYSPAGPKNYALDHSKADYLTFVDSDDYLEPDALAAWFATARCAEADAVLAPLRTIGGSILTSPRIRPSKPKILHPVRDELATRSLPHGLLRRAHLQDIGFRYSEGLRTGEDLEPTLRLSFTGGRVAYPYGSSAYCQTDDAGDARVTASIVPLEEEFTWFAGLAEQDWLRNTSRGARRSIVAKLMRVHGIGALRRRGSLAELWQTGRAPGAPSSDVLWNAGESASWRKFYLGLEKLSPNAFGTLSIRDVRLARAALVTDEASGLIDAVNAYNSAPRRDVMITQRRHLALSRNSVIRHYVNERVRRDAGVFAAPLSEARSE